MYALWCISTTSVQTLTLCMMALSSLLVSQPVIDLEHSQSFTGSLPQSWFKGDRKLQRIDIELTGCEEHTKLQESTLVCNSSRSLKDKGIQAALQDMLGRCLILNLKSSRGTDASRFPHRSHLNSRLGIFGALHSTLNACQSPTL